MYTFIIFLVFSLIEYLYYRSKLSDVKDYISVANSGAKLTGVDGHYIYKKSIMFLARVLSLFKNVMVIPIAFLALVNLIVASILGGILSLFV